MQRSLWLAVVAIAAVACQGGGQPSPSPSLSSAPPPPTPVAVRAPAQAILSDQQSGLPRLAGRDRLGYSEAARNQPDEAAALQLYVSWGWVEESTRTWGRPGAGHDLTDAVLLTLRVDGARLAFAYWAQAADQAPFFGRPCPAQLSGLDDCHYGSAGDQAIAVGRLSEEVFIMRGPSADLPHLAAQQAADLPAR